MEGAELRAEFQRRSRRQMFISLGGMALTIACFAVMAMLEPAGAGGMVMATLGGGALLATFVLSFLNWRCPACNRWFHRLVNFDYCPFCGVQVRS